LNPAGAWPSQNLVDTLRAIAFLTSTPASRQRGSFTLAEHSGDLVRLVCERCGRRGQYRKDTLLAQYPADTVLPDLLHTIAQCERWNTLTGDCGVRYDFDDGTARRHRLQSSTASRLTAGLAGFLVLIQADERPLA
jgi:hypothetical protein